MESVSNIFACLVHESFECVVDLLRNLNYFDPDSPILLYNGSANQDLLVDGFPFERYSATVVPESRPLRWGRLHDFALDCFRLAIRNYRFATLTIVDSDQLLIRGNYSDFIQQFLLDRPKVGLLSSPERQFGNQTSQFVTRVIQAEIGLWKPLVEQFEWDPGNFVRWSFWPATIFTYAAVEDIAKISLYKPQLQEILSQTRIHATEEVIFPTLVNLLGYEIQESPCSSLFVRYKVNHTPEKLEGALRMPNAYWLHPIPRQYDDPVRVALRAKSNHYGHASHPIQDGQTPDENHLFLTLPIMKQVQKVDGWLAEEEADLLIAATHYTVGQIPRDEEGVVVEVGSYCGKSTLAVGLTLKELGAERVKVYSIDSHDGVVGSLDYGIVQSPPTFEKFSRNIQEAGIAEFVEPVRARSYDVLWSRPIDLLLIDGLHDYPSVARDFFHFAPWLRPGGLVAFHDYAEYYPGVVTFVDELLCKGEYRLKELVKSLAVLEKTR